MNYGKIVEDSFSFSWKNKSLWIFGLFAGSGGNFNLDFGASDLEQTSFMGIDSFDQFWHIVLPFVWAIMILTIVFFVLNMICSPALVDAINKIARGGTYKFWESYSRGIDFFFRKVGLTIIMIAAMIGVTLVSMLPFIVLSIFGILLMIPIFFFGLFITISIYSTAERVLVVRDCSIGDALEEAYYLLKRNFGKFVVITLIFAGLAIGIGLVIGVLALMLYFPVNMLVQSMTDSLPVILILSFIFGLPITVFIGGFAGSFFHTLYTLFYFGLVDPSTPYGAKPPATVAPQPAA